MKVIFLAPLIIYVNFATGFRVFRSSMFLTDTTIAPHILDGNTGEWPEEKFQQDAGTKIRYAADNNSQTLFIALRIYGSAVRDNLMQQGMNLYIDSRGKKKENQGVEFPIKPLPGTDPVKNLYYMKLFGFTKFAPFAQHIKTEGTVNIAYISDSLSVLHIEYNIPMTLLEESPQLLSNKNISIGWKINEPEVAGDANSGQYTTTVRTLEARPAGSNSRVNNPGPVTSGKLPYNGKGGKPQQFWTSYTIKF